MLPASLRQAMHAPRGRGDWLARHAIALRAYSVANRTAGPMTTAAKMHVSIRVRRQRERWHSVQINEIKTRVVRSRGRRAWSWECMKTRRWPEPPPTSTRRSTGRFAASSSARSSPAQLRDGAAAGAGGPGQAGAGRGPGQTRRVRRRRGVSLRGRRRPSTGRQTARTRSPSFSMKAGRAEWTEAAWPASSPAARDRISIAPKRTAIRSTRCSGRASNADAIARGRILGEAVEPHAAVW